MCVFFFTAILTLQQNWAELGTSYLRLTSSPHSYTASSAMSVSHQSGAFITIHEPHWLAHRPPKSIVYIRVPLGLVYSLVFNTCNDTYWPYRIASLPAVPYLILPSLQPLIFLLTAWFSFFQNIIVNKLVLISCVIAGFWPHSN